MASGLARPGVAVLLAVLALAVTAPPAAAQKPPWEVAEAKVVDRAVGPRGDEVQVFDGDSKALKVFLTVAVKYEKVPTAAAVRAAQILDKKKKPVGQLFNVVVDKDDKKSVTLIFQSATPWGALTDLQLKLSGQTVPLEK